MSRRQPPLLALALALAGVVPAVWAQSSATQSPATATAPWRAVIQATLVVAPQPDRGGKRLELSALGWNPLANELLAVSDRGRVALVDRMPKPGESGLARLQPWRRLPPGMPHNAEGLAWRASGAGGEWLLATEPSPGAFRLSAGPSFDKAAVPPLPWPQTLSERLAQGGKHGVEALAWHGQHGLLAAAQRPEPAVAVGEPAIHVLHALHGVWRLPAQGSQSHLKAIEVLADGTVLLLERTRLQGSSAGFHSQLRWLDLGSCGGPALCEAPTVAFAPPMEAAFFNDEGLACTPTLLCWIVNDDGAASVPGTRLLQFQLVRNEAR